MDNFKVIYRILKYLEQRIDTPYATIEDLDAEKLGISQNRLEKLLREMYKSGYIDGLQWTQTLSDAFPHIVNGCRIEITMKGMEYLADNSMMKKAGELIKTAVDAVL